MCLVRDATGEAERVPPGGRAMEVLDVSGDERSSEIGMQHLSLSSSLPLVGLCALVVQSEGEFACPGF